MVVIRFLGNGLRPRVHRAERVDTGYALCCNRTEIIPYNKPIETRYYKRSTELKEGDALVSSEICGLCFRIKFTLIDLAGILVPAITTRRYSDEG